MYDLNTLDKDVQLRVIHRRRKRGGGGGGGQAPNNFRGANIPYAPPIIHPLFPSISMGNRKNHKCTKLKGKIIINATLI